jgi:hypothetical protein
MSEVHEHRLCIARCTSSVPPELDSTGLCVSHFTFNVEKACAQMHRQIAMAGVSGERQVEIAVYVEECAMLLARVASSLALSDVLKRRVLSTFLSLMNLRETLERAGTSAASPMRALKPAIESVTA